MKDLLGHLFVSTAGRDKGIVCTVVGISDDDGCVLIADGKMRKIENPKKKKLKHLKPIDHAEVIPSDRFTNRLIREAVNRLTEEA